MNRLARLIHRIVHGFTHLEHPFHMTYLGLVFAEGHSLYAYAAGGLFIVTLVVYVGELLGGD